MLLLQYTIIDIIPVYTVKYNITGILSSYVEILGGLQRTLDLKPFVPLFLTFIILIATFVTTCSHSWYLVQLTLALVSTLNSINWSTFRNGGQKQLPPFKLLPRARCRWLFSLHSLSCTLEGNDILFVIRNVYTTTYMSIYLSCSVCRLTLL
jgi:hypothetical protein